MMTFRLTADTRMAMRVMRAIRPLVWLRLLPTALATAIVMRFVRIDVQPEGWTD